MAKVTAGPVRLSYAYIFEPRPVKNPGQIAKYGAALLIPKSSTETMNKIQAAILATKQDYLAKNPKAAWINNAKTTLYDGDKPKDNGDEFSPECKGHWVLNTSSQKPPMVVDRDKQPVMDPSQIYSGCYAIAVCNFYTYDAAGNKGIACALNGVMKYADGDPLSGAKVADSDWDDVSRKDMEAFNALI